jgi:hypothetical protein
MLKLRIAKATEQASTIRNKFPLFPRPASSRIYVGGECPAPEKLLLLDLATIHLDYVAQERGYVRGGSQSARTPNTAREELPM